MERKKPPAADIGVIIGRFQVAELHAGHLELIEWVAREHRKVIIVLGVSAVQGKSNNPLDFETRMRMIKASKPEVIVVPLEDTKNDIVWSHHLDAALRPMVLPGQTVCLYGSRDSSLQHYHGIYHTEELVVDKTIAIWSGTDAREQLRVPIRDSADFRAGVIWHANNQWPRVDTTVDIAIFNTQRGLLLGRKPLEDKLRFIGGYASPESQRFEDDAVREAWEETHLRVRDVRYVDSTIIDDWRYAKERDKIKTLLFTAWADDDAARAGDDIAEVRWIPVNAVCADLFIDTHVPLYHLLAKDHLPCSTASIT